MLPKVIPSSKIYAETAGDMFKGAVDTAVLDSG